MCSPAAGKATPTATRRTKRGSIGERRDRLGGPRSEKNRPRLLSRAGVRPDIAERMLGHVQPGVAGVYDRHAYFDEKADALAKLAALIDAIVDPRPAAVAPLRLRGAR